MLMELVGAAVAAVAADIATWCFKNAAKAERQSRRAAVSRERAARRDAVRRERAERREVERETRRQLAQEAYERRGAWLDMLTAYMDDVWDMRKRTREIRDQFTDIVQANKLLLKTSPLTFQQQEAVRDCNKHLERGIARLQAYSGPYPERFVATLKDAKRDALQDNFIEPDVPEAELPDDFPVVGDNLRLSPDETETLLRTGDLALGCSECGRLSRTSSAVGLACEADVFVEDYDHDSSCWKLSLARGVIVSSCGRVESPIEATLLSPSKGGFRAVWHSPFGESVELFMPFSLVDPATRLAPWGTRLTAFVHRTDYRARQIVVGQRRPDPLDDAGDTLLVRTASAVVLDMIQRALNVSP